MAKKHLMSFGSLINRLFSFRNLAVLLLIAQAYIYIRIGIRQDAPWRYAVVGVAAVCVLGLLLRSRWALKLGMALLLGFALGKAILIRPENFAFALLIQTAALIYVAWGLWKKPDEGLWNEEETEAKPSPDDEEAPMISLVQMRSRLRYLEPEVLAQALSQAWDLKIVADAENEEKFDGFVAGANPAFMVMVLQPVRAFFTIHNREISYFDEPEEIAESINNLRFAEIIRDHSAWLSVDFIGSSNTELSLDEAYRMIGKAIAALADDETLAVYCPEHRYFNLWSEELDHTLGGEDPLLIFKKEVKAAVIQVPDGDSIEVAIAEARRRWPEFVTAFQTRAPEDTRFIVKAPFTSEDGDTEHMWLEVFGIEPEYVHGHLLNEPFHNKKLKAGSQVEVAVSDVSDWICPDAEENPMGNFTNQIVRDSARSG